MVRYSLRAGQGRLGGARHPGRCGPEAPGARQAAGCNEVPRSRLRAAGRGQGFGALSRSPKVCVLPSCARRLAICTFRVAGRPARAVPPEPSRS